MNNLELGLSSEKRAIIILESLGFEILEHTSTIQDIAPYDITARKDGIIYFIEVKSRSGNSIKFNIGRKQLLSYAYIKNLWVFLINDKDYRFFKLEDSNNKILLNGFRLNLCGAEYELERLRNDLNEDIKIRFSTNLASIRKIGERYVIVLPDTLVKYHNLYDGCFVSIANLYRLEDKK